MMTESLFSKESIQLFLSLIDNSLQTSCIQFINDCRKSCLRINRTCQQVVIVFFPSSIYICNFVLNRFGIEYEAQACRRGCSFILLFYLLPSIRIAISLCSKDEEGTLCIRRPYPVITKLCNSAVFSYCMKLPSVPNAHILRNFASVFIS